jgi:hypothetical protein
VRSESRAVGAASRVFGNVSAPLVDDICEGGWVVDESGSEWGGWEFSVCGLCEGRGFVAGG